MKVKDLIKRLEQFNPEIDIFLSNEDLLRDIDSVYFYQVKKNGNWIDIVEEGDLEEMDEIEKMGVLNAAVIC